MCKIWKGTARSSDDFHMWWHWGQLASVECTLPSWPRHSPVTSGFEPSDCSLDVNRRKAMLTFMIGEYMNFVRRGERLKWSPWCSCTLRHQMRFSLLIRIKAGFQVPGAFYLETLQWGVWHMPLTLALRDRCIPVNSSPARPTQWLPCYTKKNTQIGDSLVSSTLAM